MIMFNVSHSEMIVLEKENPKSCYNVLLWFLCICMNDKSSLHVHVCTMQLNFLVWSESITFSFFVDLSAYLSE